MASSPGVHNCRSSLAALLCAILLGAAGPGAAAQEVAAQEGAAQERVPLDRWLVTWPAGTPALDSEARDPLSDGAGAVLPNRDVVVGPGYWSLARRAPPSSSPAGAGAWIDLAGDLLDPRPEGATPAGVGAALAHAYVRVPVDRGIRLAIARPACRDAAAWLNGQRIPTLASGWTGQEGDANGVVVERADVRLGGGWNTLLVVLSEGDCPARLGGWLLPSALPAADDAGEEQDARPRDIRVQASRPPGVRRSQPAGFVEVAPLRLEGGLSWQAGTEDLGGSLIVPLVAWGRGAGQSAPRTRPEALERPSAPPEVDLTGDWDLQIFAPQGMVSAEAELEMADDGSLTGEIRGTELGGELEDGWVSGRDFRFVILPGRQSARLTYTGSVSAAGDSIRGSIAFGGAGDFSSGFRGGRVNADDDPSRPDEREREAEPEAESPAEPRAPSAGRDGPRAEGAPPGLPTPQEDARSALIRQQLLPPPENRPPAPRRVEVRVEAGGERRDTTVGGFEAAHSLDVAFTMRFEDLREASLSAQRVELRLRWRDAERELTRALPAELLLVRLHQPIALRGWREVEDADQDAPARRVVVGTWRIPAALSGFTLELRPAETTDEYRLGGQTMHDARMILCAPCRKGDRLELEARSSEEWEHPPAVVVVEPGYPAAAANPSAPPAREWLEALRGDGNGRYLELGDRFAGGGP